MVDLEAFHRFRRILHDETIMSTVNRGGVNDGAFSSVNITLENFPNKEIFRGFVFGFIDRKRSHDGTFCGLGYDAKFISDIFHHVNRKILKKRFFFVLTRLKKHGYMFACSTANRPEAKMSAQKFDLYQTVTDKIVNLIEENQAGTWSRPWVNLGADISMPLRHNSTPYRGVNVILLWIESMAKGYTSPYWFSFKQIQKMKGAKLRKDSKGCFVVYYKTLTTKDKNNPEKDVNIPLLRYYYVFNGDCVENLPEKYFRKDSVTLNNNEHIEDVKKYFAAIGGEVKHGGDRAFYTPTQDFIQMPEVNQFSGIVEYYSTLGHEYIHWSGHKSRLDRLIDGAKFGGEGYAFEELCAEMGAAFLCAQLAITCEPRADHAAYIKSWLKVLKNDKKAIFKAASYAQKAVDYLNEKAGINPIADDSGEE